MAREASGGEVREWAKGKKAREGGVEGGRRGGEGRRERGGDKGAGEAAPRATAAPHRERGPMASPSIP
eukprot:scaffold57717_cov33-Tisochrysis_lutea.AAC.1